MRLQVRNLTRDTTRAERAVHANRLWTRARGLLGHPPLQAGEGMVIEPCNSVHTFFMGYALDVVFAGKDQQVLAVEQLAPWRLSRVVWSARYAIELPAGAAGDTAVGDQLALEAA